VAVAAGAGGGRHLGPVEAVPRSLAAGKKWMESMQISWMSSAESQAAVAAVAAATAEALAIATHTAPLGAAQVTEARRMVRRVAEDPRLMVLEEGVGAAEAGVMTARPTVMCTWEACRRITTTVSSAGSLPHMAKYPAAM